MTRWDSIPSAQDVAIQGVLATKSVLDVGQSGQVCAGRSLVAADFTTLLGLPTTPAGLFPLSTLAGAGSNLGSGGNLVNKGTVAGAIGVTGAAAEAAQFTSSIGQALYILDTGTSDPFRIKTGSYGCWFRTSVVSTQTLISKSNAAITQFSYQLAVIPQGVADVLISFSGSTFPINFTGVTPVLDDRWHFGVVTFDGTTAILYIDGVLDAAATATGTIFGGTGALNIGGFGADASTAAGNPVGGRVDEAFVTADVLTPDQIRLLYAAKVAHGFSTTPRDVDLQVVRQRRGGALASGDFPSTPLHLYAFTAGALTDAGGLGTALTNNNTAVAIGGADGVTGGAFTFVAASSQSLSATDAGLPAGVNSRSYGCWVNTLTLGAYTLIGWGTVAGGALTTIGINASGNVTHDSLTGPFVADGRWHLVVAVDDNPGTYDGTTNRRLYVDGRLVASAAAGITNITLAGANRFRVGSAPDGTSPSTATIDDAFVFSGVLTADQIIAVYAKGSQALPASPKGSEDHVEAVDATNLYVICDSLDSCHQVNLEVAA